MHTHTHGHTKGFRQFVWGLAPAASSPTNTRTAAATSLQLQLRLYILSHSICSGSPWSHKHSAHSTSSASAIAIAGHKSRVRSSPDTMRLIRQPRVSKVTKNRGQLVLYISRVLCTLYLRFLFLSLFLPPFFRRRRYFWAAAANGNRHRWMPLYGTW